MLAFQHAVQGSSRRSELTEQLLAASVCRKKARQHPILGPVEAIRFLAPPLLGQDKASAAWRAVQEQRQELLSQYDMKHAELQQLAQDCSSAACSLAGEAAAAAARNSTPPMPANTAAAAAAAAVEHDRTIPDSEKIQEEDLAAEPADVAAAAAATTVPGSTDPVPGLGATAAAAGTETEAAAGGTEITDVVMEPGVAGGVVGGAAAAAGTVSGIGGSGRQAPTAEDIEEWLQRPRKAQVSMGSRCCEIPMTVVLQSPLQPTVAIGFFPMA